VELPERAVSALRAHRTRQRMERLVAGSPWVTVATCSAPPWARRSTAATVTRAFHLALERAGLPRRGLHDLRHAAATFLLSQGMTP